MSKTTLGGVLTAVFLFLLPFIWSNEFLYPSENAKYFYVLGGISLLVANASYLLFQKKLSLSLKGRYLLLLAGISLIVWYLASFLGVYLEHSLFSDILRNTGVFFITYILIGVWLLSELLNKDDWRLAKRSVIFSGAFFAFLSYFAGAGLDFQWTIGYLDFSENGLTLGNETFAGAFLVLSIILTLSELWGSPSTKTKKWLWSALVIQIASPLLLSKSFWTGTFLQDPVSILGVARASSATMFLVLLFALGVYVLNRWVSKKAVVVYTVILLVAISGAVGLLFTPGSFIQEKYIKESTAARVIIWEDAWQAFKDRPMFGWGPENFRLAQEKNLDNRLYQKDNIGEVWFDRAHNVFLDALVSVGVVGVLVACIVLLYILRVIQRAYKNGHLHYGEAYMLGALFFAHILQLQTSFNVAVTYVVLGLVVGYCMWLEKEMVEVQPLSEKKQYIVGAVLAILLIVGTISPLYGEYTRTRAIVRLISGPGHQEQLRLAEEATERLSNAEVTRYLSGSVITGLLQQVAVTRDPQTQIHILGRGHEQLSLYKERYEQYLQEMPTDYRMRMNYAYLLLTKTILGDPQLEEAKHIINESYELSPNNPLTPSMHALAALYGGELELAREKAEEAVKINENIEFTREIAEHVFVQIENFPNIEVVKVNNL